MQRTFEIEELLSEAGWLRSLAASLTGDPALADDLVQDTWVAALRHLPRADDEARPWLARVVGNLARNTRRGSLRRAAREEFVHEERVEPRPEELAQIAEAQRLLAEAVTRLPEGLRAVIVLRYFQGLDSSAAATRLGLSASAVRTRLQAALEALRADLDRRTKGGREAWAGMVAGLARLNAKSAGTLAVAGATTSALLGPWVLALVIGASAVGLTVVLTKGAGGKEEERVALGPANADDPVQNAQSSSSSASTPVAKPGTREAQAQPLASQTAPKTPPSTQTNGARISGTIRVDGRLPEWPLTVSLTPPLPPPDKDGQRARVARFEHTLAPEQRGAFVFEDLPETWSGTLEVTDYTFANGTNELEIPAPREGLALELRSGPAVFGRLLDPEEQPCRGLQAACELHLGYTSKEGELRAVVNFTTRDDGRFRIPHPGWGDFGELELRVEADGIGFLHHETPRFDPAQSLEVGELRLEPLLPLTFRIRDTRGQPIAEAVARVDGAVWSNSSVPTDAEGKSTLTFAPDRPWRCASRLRVARIAS